MICEIICRASYGRVFSCGQGRRDADNWDCGRVDMAQRWAIEVQSFEFVDRGGIVCDRLFVSPSLL